MGDFENRNFENRRRDNTVSADNTYRGGETVDIRSLTQIWPGWSVVREIGAGSYGKVYEIHRRNGGWLEKAAMKLVRIPSDPAELEQLRMDGMNFQETEAYLSRHVEEIRTEIGLMQRFVGNSNIVSYEDYLIKKHANVIGWDILIRMELLQTLPDYMQKVQFSESEVIRLGLDISQALILCHNAGIIHRDIKPQNIFVNEHGFFKLGDFGISRTEPGVGSVMSFKGTPAFMAPETFAMRGTDARSDIYSLALVLYRILNGGREPFLDTTTGITPEMRDAARRRRLMGQPVPPPVHGSAAIRQVLTKALAADPAARYQTAAQFRAALQRAAAAGTGQRTQSYTDIPPVPSVPPVPHVPPVPAPFPNYGERTPDRRRMLIVLLAALSILLLFFGVWSVLSSRGRNDKRREDSVTTYAEAEEAAASEPAPDQQTQTEASGNGPAETGSGQDAGTAAAQGGQAAYSPGGGGYEGYGIYGGSDDSDGFDDADDVDDSVEESSGSEGGSPAGADPQGAAPPDEKTPQQEEVPLLDQPVDFADPALKKAVESYLGITGYDITKGEARGIETLKLSGEGKGQNDAISDLTGLEEFTNLTTLILDHNRISDLEPLSSLTHISELHLELNQIPDLSPIADLTGLKKLDLEQNMIEDISVVERFQGLEMLDIRANMVYDISPVRGLTGLRQLYLSDNRITSIEPVRDLHRLYYLSMNNNPIDSIAPVADLEELTTLCLSGCTQVSDIRVLEGLPLLGYLDISGCSVPADDSTVKKLKKREHMTVKR